MNSYATGLRLRRLSEETLPALLCVRLELVPYLIYQPDGVSLEEGRDEAAYMIAVTRSRLGKGESKL